MTAATSIVLLWLGFAGSHLLLSHLPVRDRLVARLGAQPFQGLYSLIALAFFVPLVWVYFDHLHEGPWLWVLPHGGALTRLVELGMALAFVLILAGLLRPSPASLGAGPTAPTGAFRIARHPMFMGIGLFGALHLLLNASATDVAFFAGFPIFALVGCAHQDQRKLAKHTPGYAEFVAATPFVPFTGGATLRGLREMGPVPIVLGVVVALVVRWAHRFWEG
jgi:uncharacterized membrane protein